MPYGSRTNCWFLKCRTLYLDFAYVSHSSILSFVEWTTKMSVKLSNILKNLSFIRFCEEFLFKSANNWIEKSFRSKNQWKIIRKSGVSRDKLFDPWMVIMKNWAFDSILTKLKWIKSI